MNVNFEKTLVPCVTDEAVLWHVAHGYVWNICEVSGRYVGVLFATLLCGDGVILHFLSVPGIDVSPATVLAAFKKAELLFPLFGNVVFATVPAERYSLISLLCRIGFRQTGVAYERRGTGRIVLLQYFSIQ